MSEIGTVKLHRGIFKHPAFAREPFTAREAWIWLIVAAAPRADDYRVGRVMVDLERGQLAFSHRFMARRFKWPVAKVQRFLSRLVAESMISQAVTESGITRVTILNYAKFNDLSVAASVAESVNESARESQEPAPSHCDIRQKPPPLTESESASDTANESKKDSKTTDSESVVGVGSARARAENYITEQAFKLADEIMLTFGIDREFIPPGWCGAPMWLQAGLNSGWQPEIVRVACAKIRARKQFQPPYSFRYLGKPIAREHEIWARPNLPLPPIAVADNPEKADAKTPDAADWRSRRDAKHQAFADFCAANRQRREHGSDDGDGNLVRLVPDARRCR